MTPYVKYASFSKTATEPKPLLRVGGYTTDGDGVVSRLAEIQKRHETFLPCWSNNKTPKREGGDGAKAVTSGEARATAQSGVPRLLEENSKIVKNCIDKHCELW